MSKCNFCLSVLSSIYALNRHKKESKKCKLIQTKKSECNICLLSYDKENFQKHIFECSKIKLEEKENEILELKNKINEYETKYILIEKELEVYKEQNKELLKQPRTTNTYNDNRKNYYVKFNLSPLNLTDEQIKNTVDDKYDKNYLFDGQKGIADFSYEHFLTNPKTNDVYYAVSDKSRYYFVYKKNDTEYFIDMKGKHFLDRITPHVFNKSQNILEEVKDSDNKIDYFTAFGEIKSCKLGGDISRFTKHLAELCNNKNLKILNEEKKIIDDDETVSVITLYTDDEYEEDDEKNKEDEVYDYVSEYEKVKDYNYDDSYVKTRFIKEHNEKTRIQMEKDGIVSDKYFVKIESRKKYNF